MSENGLISGQTQPTMIEFLKNGVELSNTNIVTLTVNIRPSVGVWATKRVTKDVSVQVIKH